MEDVSKHDPEFEGKGDAVEQRGVHFLVTGDTIGVCQQLEGLGDVVLAEVGRRVQLHDAMLLQILGQILHLSLHHFASHLHIALVAQLHYCMQVLQLHLWHPALSHHAGSSDSLLVHGFLNALLHLEEGVVQQDLAHFHRTRVARTLPQLQQDHVDALVLDDALLLQFGLLLLLGLGLFLLLLRNVEGTSTFEGGGSF